MEAAQVCKSMKLLPGWAPRSLQRTARWTSTHMSCKCLLHNFFPFRFSTLGICYFSFLVFHILTSLSWLIAKLLFCVSADEWESERERRKETQTTEPSFAKSSNQRTFATPHKKTQVAFSRCSVFRQLTGVSSFYIWWTSSLLQKKWNNALRNLHLAHLILSSRGSDGKLHLSSSTGWTDRRCRKEWIGFLNSLANEPLPHVSGLIFRCRG